METCLMSEGKRTSSELFKKYIGGVDKIHTSSFLYANEYNSI